VTEEELIYIGGSISQTADTVSFFAVFSLEIPTKLHKDYVCLYCIHSRNDSLARNSTESSGENRPPCRPLPYANVMDRPNFPYTTVRFLGTSISPSSLLRYLGYSEGDLSVSQFKVRCLSSSLLGATTASETRRTPLYAPNFL
jgi:hypothetical protein